MTLESNVPAWLLPLLGQREKRILSDKRMRCLFEDDDGQRLPNHQQILFSPEHGSFMIDSKKRKIIG